ncbi:MAG: hypothetical protein H6831_13350 [Planctomycetes bacterium]|nr:hypothetical protein [Planctomycetota bacterium]
MPEFSDQQFPDEDLHGDGQEPTGGSSAMGGQVGNRPAGGAPVMRPDEMAADEWETQGNAQDFLGLDGTPNHRPDAQDGTEYQSDPFRETGSALADAPELEEGEFENWLTDDSEDSASWLMELEDQPDEDVFDPERLETEFGIQQSATASSRGGWILRVTLVAAGLAAGFVGARWYGDQQLKQGGETNVARVQRTTPVTTKTTNTSTNGNTANGTPTADGKPQTNAAKNGKNGKPEQNGSTTETAPITETNTDVVATAPMGTRPTTEVNTTTEPTVDVTTTTTGDTELTPDPFFPELEGTETVASETETTTTPDSGTRNPNGKTFTMPVEDMVVVPRVESSLRYASEKDLAAVWHEREIPLDRIAGTERLLTPQVGRVRLVIHGGEIFEGRLYAVGENKVWLDTGTGKMALLGWQVDRIEHIADKVSATLGEKGSEDLTGLQRVRVRTPGGVFYGKLLDQDENNVTLITEDGGRIRLANARVEPAGKSRTRIVDPGGAKAQEAASKPE